MNLGSEIKHFVLDDVKLERVLETEVSRKSSWFTISIVDHAEIFNEARRDKERFPK